MSKKEELEKQGFKTYENNEIQVYFGTRICADMLANASSALRQQDGLSTTLVSVLNLKAKASLKDFC